MDVFSLREHLVDTYRDYATSFVRFRDGRIRECVDEALLSGRLWPHPRVGLNPSFKSGGSVDDLVADGVLHSLESDIFRRNKSHTDARGKAMELHQHQVEAIRIAAAGRNYLLTTGTGSGKSLAYIIPIVDHVLQSGGTGRGVQGIVVYPMNALANSQQTELAKFLDHGPWGDQRPVTFARYTGQDDNTAREAIQQNPPDILLTNYVMLELILTRYTDKPLLRALKSLRFLVLDELHTYRGRQGADVSLLVRRLREASNVSRLLCVGTSATLSTEGSLNDRNTQLADVGSRLFGDVVNPSDVIGETLQRVTLLQGTPDHDADTASTSSGVENTQNTADYGVDTVLTEKVKHSTPPLSYDEFVADPLSCWLESVFGVEMHDGCLIRAIPRPVEGDNGAASELSAVTGLDELMCAEAIRQYLLAGSKILKSGSEKQPVFAFRLHQFVSHGDTVYASLELPAARYLTLSGQRFVPGSDRKRVLLPLAFCRECGQDYYTVHQESTPTDQADVGFRLTLRDLTDQKPDEGREAGFLFLDDTDLWPQDSADQLAILPREWFDHNNRLRRNRQNTVPQLIHVNPDGSVGYRDGSVAGWWVPAPFRFCLACRVSYTSPNLGSDFTRLSTLGSGGRATATTIMSLTTVQHLRAAQTLDTEAQKLLSFTDNRQDASLQAGHFNDFVEVTMLRSALWEAVSASPDGVRHDQLSQRVFEKLRLPRDAYAGLGPDLRGRARQNTDRTIREVLAYRLYRDLRRGWRVTQPNLEQVGLLRIEYESLSDLANDQQIWDGCHHLLTSCDPERREFILRVLLDWMRSQLAVRVNVLKGDYQDALQQRAQQYLRESWALENEELEPATEVLTRPRRPNDRHQWCHMSGRGAFGRFLSNDNALGAVKPGVQLRIADRDRIISDLFEGLRIYGLVTQVEGRTDDHRRWQIPAGALIWKEGDGTPYRDHLRVVSVSESGLSPNSYFTKLYRNTGVRLAGIEAREHTAQVPSDLREEREENFRRAKLPVLYCSPTMELGVDISDLNVVNMRNVPPTPANYAQRSGRAGRGGQPALVFTYCASGNSHDQYFFRHQERMISGQVEAPRIDLTNKALLRAHVHALWLTESGLDLGQSMTDILDISDSYEDNRPPRLRSHVQDCLHNSQYKIRAHAQARKVLADIIPDLPEQLWWSDTWLDDTLQAISNRFSQALERWMALYTAAVTQVHEQTRISLSGGRSPQDQKRARQLRAEAERQLDVLKATTDHRGQSDFYPYRYFASEGFLPGYSFPRLPLSAFIPGRRLTHSHHQSGDYLQRPRFLAISEFGPQSHIYHEGSRYKITRVILSRDSNISSHSIDSGYQGIAGDSRNTTGGGLTERAKRCDDCGYMHPFLGPPGPDVCEGCNTELTSGGWDNLLQMRNVSTVRRERITSDEERRRKAGYDIIAGLRFAERGNDGRSVIRTSLRAGTDSINGKSLLELTYGDTATIWRVNLGWRRRVTAHNGFLLNTETGLWGSSNRNHRDENDPDPEETTTHRVVPYVTDARNVLLIKPAEPLRLEEMASLQAALKAAVQVVFHLESSELAVEPLPARDNRRSLFIYESAEGGAGALHRLVNETRLWQKVAEAALNLCHVDNPNHECGGACYDCLLTYQNQLDHDLLDRAHVVPFLHQLLTAELATPDHARQLRGTTSLETQFLAMLKAGGYRLPDREQVHFVKAGTRPDFVYDDACVAVYVDGPHHDYPDRAARDRDQDAAMNNLGYRVIRFTHRDNWERMFTQYQRVFGIGNRHKDDP